MSTISRGRDQFAKYKGIFKIITGVYKVFPVSMRKKAFEKKRNARGKFGIGFRYAILKSITDSVGDNVAIFPGVYVFHPENLIIGDNVSIQPMCYIECGNIKGGITIGNNVSIAHGVTIMATTHTFDDPDVPIKDQDVIDEPVRIEENVWIGAKASVLSGVTIRRGCVVGAGAVVTKSTDSDGVYVGVLAKLLKSRI